MRSTGRLPRKPPRAPWPAAGQPGNHAEGPLPGLPAKSQSTSRCRWRATGLGKCSVCS